MASHAPRTRSTAALIFCVCLMLAHPAAAERNGAGAGGPGSSARASTTSAPASTASPAARAASTTTAPTPKLTAEELQRLAAASSDSAAAPDVVRRLKAYLAGKPDSNFVQFARLVLVQGMITAGSPATELVAAVDKAGAYLPPQPEAHTSFYAAVALCLSNRGEALDRALGYARKAVASCPTDDQHRTMLALARGTLGEVQLNAGRPEEAVVTLARAVSNAPDSQRVLRQLGRAYEKTGRQDAAIGVYIRSLGVFGGRDSAAAAPLRALYARRHGSLAGLDERLAAARRASREKVALAAHRQEREAPAWVLPDLAGKTVRLADFKGRLVVLDFWGSWCGPCRLELPLIQALYERYWNRKEVAFLGMNWERVSSADLHQQRAREYMRQHKLTFPVVYDAQGVAVESYGIEAFPTVLLIDRGGTIRYRNVGFDPNIQQILEAQIESLLE